MYKRQGFRETTSNKKIEKLGDFKGLKIRTMENPYHINFWKDVYKRQGRRGAEPVALTIKSGFSPFINSGSPLFDVNMNKLCNFLALFIKYPSLFLYKELTDK